MASMAPGLGAGTASATGDIMLGDASNAAIQNANAYGKLASKGRQDAIDIAAG